MKKITVHGWVQDNAGSYHQAGAVLTVDDEGGKDCIGAKAADHLIKLHSASPHHSDHKAVAK
jgi:hypothetical protein